VLLGAMEIHLNTAQRMSKILYVWNTNNEAIINIKQCRLSPILFSNILSEDLKMFLSYQNDLEILILINPFMEISRCRQKDQHIKMLI
jgi:hypothetical protein